MYVELLCEIARKEVIYMLNKRYAEGRKKEASKVKQTTKQSNTQQTYIVYVHNHEIKEQHKPLIIICGMAERRRRLAQMVKTLTRSLTLALMMT